MPQIEVFVGLDALRSGSEAISSELPTRAELRAWVVEHDKIEKETEIFDAGEFRKLKKFTKGPSPSFPRGTAIMMPIFAITFSRRSKEPVPRRHRLNRNHSYDNICPRQVTAFTSRSFRKSRTPCDPVNVGRTSTCCLDGLPQTHEGPWHLPEESCPMVSLDLRERRRRGHQFIWRWRYPRPSWVGCLYRICILGYHCR